MKNLLISVITLLVFASCTGGISSGSEEVKGTVSKVKYAKNFRIVKHKDFTELQLLQPDNGKTEIAYALTDRKKNVRIPAGLIEVKVPVQNVTALSTTHIGMLSAIGELGIVNGTTDERYISNAVILKGVRSGKIITHPDETTVSPAKLVQSKTDLVMYSGFGGEFPNNEKLRKLGIVTMANYDWREQHPLGKAEWLKVFGCLTGKEKEAQHYFDEVEKSYQTAQKEIKNVRHREKVIVGSLIGDIWFAPAGGSYMAQILKDAGADYVYSNEAGTGSCEKSFAQVLRDQQQCDFWINPGASSIAGLLSQNGKYALFNALEKKQVYCYTGNSNYFWEMSAVNPHWILSDFAVILGTQKQSKLHFYKLLR